MAAILKKKSKKKEVAYCGENQTQIRHTQLLCAQRQWLILYLKNLMVVFKNHLNLSKYTVKVLKL